MLAHRPESRRAACLEALLADPAARERAHDELRRVRAEGVAFNRGETLPDVSAAARPVLVAGTVRAVVAVAGPTSRIAARLETVADGLRDAVRTVAARLGG
ncbi:IclR family transcriptional regulator domain-containing protein [Streptomyces albus]